MASKNRHLSYSPLLGTLHIVDGDRETGYFVDQLAEGVWLFTKIIGREERKVVLAPTGNTCTCPGFRRWGHKTVCRHVAAILALRERGRI